VRVPVNGNVTSTLRMGTNGDGPGEYGDEE
jgi:hypothetical protein